MEEQDKFCEYLSGVSPVWCPGCGNYGILSSRVEALGEIDLATKDIALISGIGCASRLPYFVKAYGFHGIHGRTLPIAQGVKVANPELTVVRSRATETAWRSAAAICRTLRATTRT